MSKTENDSIIDPFKVYLRIRPLAERELTGECDKYANKNTVTVDENSVYCILYSIKKSNKGICRRPREHGSM